MWQESVTLSGMEKGEDGLIIHRFSLCDIGEIISQQQNKTNY